MITRPIRRVAPGRSGPLRSSAGAFLLGASALALVAFSSLGGALTQAFAMPRGDSIIGTLPMYGDTGADFFDQTVTLRGDAEVIRRALQGAGGDGAVEVIHTGGGHVWMRFYGDVHIELEMAELAEVEVEIFTGFDGNGMNYAVGQANGFGSVRQLGPGGEIRLDPIRLSDAGLLDQTLFVVGLHQSGTRTNTSLQLQPASGRVVIRQDV